MYFLGEGYYSIEDLECMSGKLAKISLMSYRMVGYKPSLVAASSVFLAKYILNPSERPWNRTVQHYTGYEPSDLKECVLELAEARDLYGYVAYAIPTSQPPPIPSHFFTNFG
ncbi:cyclin [Castilleja foliolosa]|uniref:Cyclin n=1 Tax=Castilleja foliolosa TaxID=1961234 RepID=A0ABD3DZ04_9LAMI